MQISASQSIWQRYCPLDAQPRLIPINWLGNLISASAKANHIPPSLNGQQGKKCNNATHYSTIHIFISGFMKNFDSVIIVISCPFLWGVKLCIKNFGQLNCLIVTLINVDCESYSGTVSNILMYSQFWAFSFWKQTIPALCELRSLVLLCTGPKPSNYNVVHAVRVSVAMYVLCL